MKRGIIGGIISLVIGGASFAVSKSDVVNNFSRESGMSQQQAQQYVDSVQGNLTSFSTIGSKLVEDGNSVLSNSSKLDCDNYTYGWVSAALSCSAGKSELETVGNSEMTLGDCYKSLAEDLGDAVKTKISECIGDIDSLNNTYELPVTTALLDAKTLSDQKNTNIYNKSVLQAALK